MNMRTSGGIIASTQEAAEPRMRAQGSGAGCNDEGTPPRDTVAPPASTPPRPRGVGAWHPAPSDCQRRGMARGASKAPQPQARVIGAHSRGPQEHPCRKAQAAQSRRAEHRDGVPGADAGDPSSVTLLTRADGGVVLRPDAE